MAEAKTKVSTGSVAKFLGAIKDDQIRKDCKVVSAMLAKASGKKAEMWGAGIVGFGRRVYQGRSGSMEWMEVGFAPRKNAITLYLGMGLGGFDALLAKLGKHDTGKGCLYVKRLADVDVPTLNKIMVESVKRVRKRTAS